MTGRWGAGIVLSLLIVNLLTVARLNAQERPAAPPAGGVYRRPLQFDPVTLDPARIADIYGRSVAQQIFDGLVQFDQTLTVVPALAEFWRASRDGLTWRFSLRKGVRFHDGREVTADDVVHSFTRLVDPRVRSAAADLFVTIVGAREFREGRASRVSGLTALDRYTVEVVLTESFAPFAALAAVGQAKIVPKDLGEAGGEGLSIRPVGTGPFKFLRWDRGKQIVLEANPDYFQGPPRLARLIYRIFSGQPFDAIYEHLQRGELEDAPVPPRDYPAVTKDPRYVYVKRPTFSVRFYGFNTRVRPFDDRRVRQAIAHALDRETIVQEFQRGRYLVAHGILPPGTLGFNPRLRGHSYDLALARARLAESGHPGGAGLPAIEIWAGTRESRVVREHEQIQRSLAALGLRTEVRYQTEWPAFSRMLNEARLPMFLYAWFADVPDPDNFLFKLFHSQSSRNFFGYSNPVVDDLLVRARREPDGARRTELYRRAESLILEDAPVVPIWHYTYERLFQPYVKSVEVSGLGDPYIPFRNVWLERR